MIESLEGRCLLSAHGYPVFAQHSNPEGTHTVGIQVASLGGTRAAAATPVPVPVEYGDVVVTATQAWQNTGITVVEGSQINYISGSWSTGDGVFVDANGDQNNITPQGYPFPGAPAGVLVGRIGNDGSPFLVGDSAVVSSGEGILQLVINDDIESAMGAGLADNAGSLTVNVSRPLAWGKLVTHEFKAKVVDIAANLAADPNNLMAAMAFESAMTFSPNIQNPAGPAVGLIQFTPTGVKRLHVTLPQLAAMTAVEQLDYVYKFLKPYTGRLRSVSDLYMAIIWPRAIGKSDSYVLFSKGSKYYKANSLLDADGDGKITKAEAAGKVVSSLALGMTDPYFG